MIELHNGDCLEVMQTIQDKSIDLILCDLPYGTTNCKWDVIIDFDKLWLQYDRIIKDNGAVVLFGTSLFFYKLCLSNEKMYRYELIWQKERLTNIFFVKKQFGKVHENIAVFYKTQPTYNPQKEKRLNNTIGVFGKEKKSSLYTNQTYKYSKDYDKTTTYPISILKFNRDTLKEKHHPTQKPVPLLEHLIKTYTNENELVLDNCMGSGSTGVACKNINRNFIGIEKDNTYFEIAKKRIEI